MTDLYGLIGKKLSHSFSPAYFKKKFDTQGLDADYRLFELDDISELPALINEHTALKGLNVTVPYKIDVFALLDDLDRTAMQTQSVNTIKISRKNNTSYLKGYNTDVIGFEQSLLPLLQKQKVTKALILGTGGSARAVAFVLKNLGIECQTVSRNPVEKHQISYGQISKEIIDEHQLIVQTTPLGMFPLVDDAPSIPYQFLNNKHLLYELIYNPSETKFLTLGKKNGASIYNGRKMLAYQAEASWNIWKK